MRRDAGLHALSERRGRPFEHRGLAEHDRIRAGLVDFAGADGCGGDRVTGQRRP